MTGKKFTAIIGAIITLIALAGCDQNPDDDVVTQAVTKSQCTDYSGHDFRTCVITMPDTRRVTCIQSNDTSAVSCDWTHVDGADMGWSE